MSADTHPPLTSDNNEQMLSELGKKHRGPPTRATLAGAGLTRGAAGSGAGAGGLGLVGWGRWAGAGGLVGWWAPLVPGFTGAQTFSGLAPRVTPSNPLPASPPFFSH